MPMFPVKMILCLAFLLMQCARPGLSAPNPSPVTAQVRVNWGVTKAHTTPLLFGTNDWAVIQNPASTLGDDRFARGLAQTGIGFMRLHNGGLCDAWTDHAAKTWDAAKINAVYSAPYLRGKTILQNIPIWAPWMKTTDGLLDRSEYEAYAAFCADLVRIVNVRQNRHVRYWEPFNEEDVRYFNQGKFDDLCALYNKVAAAMKAVDPTIQVGGLAFTWADPAKIEAFLKNCGPRIDFLSWHQYAGDGHDPTDKIMAGTRQDDAELASLRALVARFSPNRPIPLAWDEYSLAWTYQSPEIRQWSSIGAVWFASTLKHMAEAGVEMGGQWNLKDGFYGLMDNEDQLRPAATVYTWANAYLVGAVAETTSDLPLTEALAVRQRNGTRSLLLINKADAPVRIVVRTDGPNIWGRGRISVLHLGARGETRNDLAVSELRKGLVLPPYSLALLRR